MELSNKFEDNLHMWSGVNFLAVERRLATEAVLVEIMKKEEKNPVK